MTFFEDGEKVKRLVKQKPEDVIIAKGKHPAIIDEDTFETAQRVTAGKPKNKVSTELKNCLSTLLVCGKCGRAMARDVHPKSGPRYVCKAHVPQCFKYAKESEVLDALVVALESSELPELKLKVKNNEGSAVKIQQRLIDKLRAQLVEFEMQEENLYDLLEQKVYTPEVFTRRHAALTAKVDACREDLEKAKKAMPKSVNYEERVETLERAIALLKDPSATPEEKNKVLRTIISSIVYHGTEHGKCRYRENYFNLEVFLRL
jgi:hypothetical protein